MADTVVSPNNQQVRFRGKGDRMAKAAIDTEAKTDSTPDKLQTPSKPPKAAPTDSGDEDRLAKRGMISPKQMANMKAKKAKLAPSSKTASDKDGDGVDDAIEGEPEAGGKLDAIKPPKGNKDGDADEK